MSKLTGCVSPQFKSENQCNGIFYFVLYVPQIPLTTDNYVIFGISYGFKNKTKYTGMVARRQKHFKEGLKIFSGILSFQNEKGHKRMVSHTSNLLEYLHLES